MSIEFDSNPVIYWLAGYGIACCICILIFLSASGFRTHHERIYLAISGLLVLQMRLPVILFNRELNADESQMLTQGMTLFKNPVYWQSVDGTTGGPLGSYFLIIPSLLTGTFDYCTAHTGSVLLVFVTLTGFYFALRNWFGSVTAMTATFPLTLFFAFTQQEDFVHYSSEHVPMAMMAVILYLLSICQKRISKSFFPPFFLGVLIACLPFGKLQTLPMVAALVLWAFYIFWNRSRLFNDGIWFIAGGVGTLAIMCALLASINVFDDFITFYIIGNFQYGGGISWVDNLLELPANLLKAPAISWFFLPQIILLVVVLLSPERKKTGFRPIVAFPLIWIFFTLMAISRTGSGYLHYWLFAVIPVGMFFANYLDLIKKNSTLLSGFALMSLLFIAVPKAISVLKKNPINSYASDHSTNRSLPFTNIAKSILKYGNEGEYLAVWGWNCQFYVETQMPQGVAENHSIRSIFRHPMQKTYLERYVKNIRETNPIVIVDAVGKNSLWVQDKRTQSLENYPDLYKQVSANYKLAETVDDARIFVRNDRLNP
jgi:hypothetical protein